MVDDLKNLKKLPPQERIKKLQELLEKNKDEIQKAQDLIKSSKEEDRQEQELKKVPVPELKKINLDDLFSKEEVKEKKEEQEEESIQEPLDTIAQEAPQQTAVNVEYASHLSQQPATQLQERMTGIYTAVKEQGYMNLNQQQELANIDYASRKKMNDLKSGTYTNPGKEVAETMIATQTMKNWLQDKYHAGQQYRW